MLFLSQEDTDYSSQPGYPALEGYHGGGISPARKRNKGRMTLVSYPNSQDISLMDSASMMSAAYPHKEDKEDSNDGSLVNGKGALDLFPSNSMLMSQESNIGAPFSLSQFSQDFAERLGNMQMRGESQDDAFPFNDSRSIAPAGSKPDNNNVFSMPVLPSGKNLLKGAATNKTLTFTAAKRNSMTHGSKTAGSGSSNLENLCPNSMNSLSQQQNSFIKGGKSSSNTAGAVEPEKLIEIPPANENPYLVISNSHNGLTNSDEQQLEEVEYYYQNYSNCTNNNSNNNKKRKTKNVKLWIGAFKPRPRYTTDFEEVLLLGEGTFSAVFASRNRNDGLLYAIKKCKESINSTAHQNLLMKEVYALSYLTSLHCPNLIRYYSSWIYEQQLFIQLELCHLGSLEDLISSIPSKTSIVRALYSHYQSSGIAVTNSHSSTNAPPTMVFLPNDERNRADSYASVDPESCFGSQTTNIPTPGAASRSPLMTVEKGIQEDLAWTILHQLGETLSFMHSKEIVHLDLRPANIFLQFSPSLHRDKSKENTTGQSTSLFSNIIAAKKLSQMHSLSCVFSQDKSTRPTSSVGMNSSEKQQLYLQVRNEIEQAIVSSHYLLKLGDLGHCRQLQDKSLIIEGETRYCPRELIDLSVSKIDLTKCDVFSLGCSLYELCLGRYLGHSGEEGLEEWHAIRDGNVHSSFLISKEYSPELKQLVQLMLSPDPQQRPSAKQVQKIAQENLRRKQAMKIEPLEEDGDSTASVQSLVEENQRLKKELQRLTAMLQAQR